MHDCRNGDIRDLLPDYAHGALAAAERARVDAHLAGCGACRDELALLRAVVAARPEPLVPDIARIVAALPRPAAPLANASRDVLPIHARRRGGAGGLPWRRIAGIAAVLVGAVGIGVVGRRTGSDLPDRPTIVPARVTDAPRGAPPGAATGVVPAVPARADSPVATGTQRTLPRTRGGESADAVGALGGIASGATEDELEALIGDLESLSGIPEVEAIEGEESVRTGGTE